MSALTMIETPRELSLAQRLVLTDLHEQVGPQQTGSYSQAEAGQRLGVCKRTVVRSLAALRDEGLLSYDSGLGATRTRVSLH